MLKKFSSFAVVFVVVLSVSGCGKSLTQVRAEERQEKIRQGQAIEETERFRALREESEEAYDAKQGSVKQDSVSRELKELQLSRKVLWPSMELKGKTYYVVVYFMVGFTVKEMEAIEDVMIEFSEDNCLVFVNGKIVNETFFEAIKRGALPYLALEKSEPGQLHLTMGARHPSLLRFNKVTPNCLRVYLGTALGLFGSQMMKSGKRGIHLDVIKSYLKRFYGCDK
jgi:hypothetical protein